MTCFVNNNFHFGGECKGQCAWVLGYSYSVGVSFPIRLMTAFAERFWWSLAAGVSNNDWDGQR